MYRVGTSLDKTYDMGPIVSKSQWLDINRYVEEARDEGAEIFQVSEKGNGFYPPTIITNVNTASTVVMEEIFGPGKTNQ